MAACDEEILRKSEGIAPTAWGLVRLAQRGRNSHRQITQWKKLGDYTAGAPYLFGDPSRVHGILHLRQSYTKYQKAPLRSTSKGSK